MKTTLVMGGGNGVVESRRGRREDEPPSPLLLRWSALPCMISREGGSHNPCSPRLPNTYSSMFTNTPLGDLMPSKRVRDPPPSPYCAHASTPKKKGPQDLRFWIVTTPMLLLNPMSNEWSSEVVFVRQNIFRGMVRIPPPPPIDWACQSVFDSALKVSRFYYMNFLPRRTFEYIGQWLCFVPAPSRRGNLY